MILWAAREAVAIVTVSAALRDTLAALGVDAGNISVIRNGVDLEIFKPHPLEAARQALGLPQGPLIVSVGNLVTEKGHDIVIRSLPLMKATRLAIVGEGPDRTRLERIAREASVSDRVSFLPVRPQQDLAVVYSAADALVLASSREGLPNVLLEAMACGTRVVAADVGGVREAVSSPEVGLVLSACSPDTIAAAVHELTSSYPHRHNIRQYAARFSWHAACSDLSDLLTRVVQQSGSNPADQEKHYRRFTSLI